MNTFKTRGYIEGFYGTPWTAQQRLEMLRFMAAAGENTYYYAPKDDPYHRKYWKEPYPDKEFAQLKKTVDTARESGIDFHYCIAPGLSMCYSSDEDLSALFGKTESLYDIGIRGFGLLLDDIPEELFYEQDKNIYGEAVNAHIDLCLKYYERLKQFPEVCHLTVCPLQYCGKGTESYITKFASALPEDVSVFFTGADICSKELTSREAEIFYRSTGHRPLYWDNYPVNDAEMFKEMHLSPLTGRDKDLYMHSEGIISNCMEYFECSKFALKTAADYMNAPENYEPEKSFADTVSLLVPDDIREAFILFADHLRTSCLKDENSRIMGQYLYKANMLKETGRENEAMAVLEEYTEKVRCSAEILKKQTAPLFAELEEWLGKYYMMADILCLALDVLKGSGDRQKLKDMMKIYNDKATVLTAFCFREYIESVI